VIDDFTVVNRPPKLKRKRRRARADASFEAPEWLVPLGLFAAAVLTNVLLALRGPDGGKGLVVFSLIDLAVTVPVTIGGMFVAAAAMGIDFGGIFTALKVAAIAATVQCIYLIGMSGDGDRSAAVVLLLALPVYLGMFAWLFGLTFVEAIQATVFIGLVQKGVNTLLTLLAAGILLKLAAAP
jgi:hypothetical protein